MPRVSYSQGHVYTATKRAPNKASFLTCHVFNYSQDHVHQATKRSSACLEGLLLAPKPLQTGSKFDAAFVELGSTRHRRANKPPAARTHRVSNFRCFSDRTSSEEIRPRAKRPYHGRDGKGYKLRPVLGSELCRPTTKPGTGFIFTSVTSTHRHDQINGYLYFSAFVFTCQ